jgi:hypothetical protein
LNITFYSQRRIRTVLMDSYAPPQLCWESGSVQASPVRRFFVL